MLVESSRLVVACRASLTDLRTGAELIEHVTKRELSQLFARVSDEYRYVPFCADLIMEPPATDMPIRLLDVLPEERRSTSVDVESSLRPPEELAEVDTSLRGRCHTCLGPPGEWLKYLRRADAHRLWTLAPATEAKRTCSVVAVMKSDRSTLRKLAQRVPLNEPLFTPDTAAGHHVDLGLFGGAAISQVVTANDRVLGRSLDEGNPFGYLELPHC